MESRDRNDQVIDLTQGQEEENSKDSDSDDGDQVTETTEAKSEEGKQPVFHYEIFDRLGRLMSRQGAYGTPHQQLHL